MNPDTLFLFSQKVPPSGPPPGSPTGPLWREREPLTGNFCVPLETLIKIPLNKKYFSFSPRPKEKSAPTPHVPQKWAIWKQTPISRPYLTYLSGSPVKEPSLKVPFVESLTERCPIPRALLHSSFKVPGLQAPYSFQVPLGCKEVPMDRDAHIRSLS